MKTNPNYLPTWRSITALSIALAATWLAAVPGQSADDGHAPGIRFRLVPAAESGIQENPGTTFAGAWGDVNADGYPDLWLNNHLDRRTTFYLNQRDGTFKEATAEVFAKRPDHDNHGMAFADFDNDGDQDLISLVGAGNGIGTNPEVIHSRLYVNENGKLEERATALGIGYPLARGRSPLWIDFNRDGLLDLVFGVDKRRDQIERPATIFQQRADHTFADASAITGFKLENAPEFICSDLSRDGKLDLVVDNSGSITVYDMAGLPFADITKAVLGGSLGTGADMACADFNGDLQPDLYIARADCLAFWGLTKDGFHQNSPNKVSLRVVRGGRTAEKGLQFESTGDVTMKLGAPWNRLALQEIYLGAKGSHPASFELALSPTDPEMAGVFPHKAGVDEGVYIGYDPVQERWQILASKRELVAFIESDKPITQSVAIGLQANAGQCDDSLLMNSPQGLVDKSGEAGIRGIPRRSAGVVAGDFDNDMDVDLYIVTLGTAVNTPDILYDNQGDGTFVAVPLTGGAAGTELGVGDFAITADYDQDGFLDLLVANGNGSPDPMVNQGPYQLFQNAGKQTGNRNHWLAIDLQGVRSNRDGIGAQVFVTAGGVTQLREQTNGTHHRVQNHRRLHFGLGSNTVAQELRVQWPSGATQRIQNVKADQVLRIVEADGK